MGLLNKCCPTQEGRITQQSCCICTLVKQLGHISLFSCSFSCSLLSESVHHKAAHFLLHHSIPPLTFPSFSTHSLLIAAACLADSEDSLHASISLNCHPECKQGNNNHALAEEMGVFFSFAHSVGLADKRAWSGRSSDSVQQDGLCLMRLF